MKNKEFDEILKNSHNMNYFCGVWWGIDSSYWTKGICLDYKLFNSYTERDNYLINHHRWWENLPFITKGFWVNY